MSLLIVYGILLISTGAFMSGSFALPFDKVRDWKWENYWLIYALFAYVVFPLAVCAVFAPGFWGALQGVPSATLLWVAFLGMIYGAANLAFGLSLRYLGLALGYALSLGLMMALGTLVPPMIDGKLARLFEGSGGVLLLAGVAVSLCGIALSGYAGYRKSRSLQQGGVNSEFNLKKGLAAALFVGVAGSAAALGIEQGAPIARAMLSSGVNPLYQDCAVFQVLYAGSFVTTLGWCLYLGVRGKSLRTFVSLPGRVLLLNWLCCAAAGFLWYINYLFFGMGKAQMGEFSFVAWGILMTMTIVFATVWGLCRGEWKGADRRTRSLMWAGLLVLVAASFLIGISSSI